MRIGVYGLGYVGLINATCFAQRGHTVTGVDIDRRKVELVNRGISPVREQGLDPLLAAVVADGSLHATDDAVATVRNTDLSIVCVGTPSNGNGSLGLGFLEHVALKIGEGLRDHDGCHVVAFRSTMLPGTVEKTLIPILTRVSRRPPCHGYSVVVHPEFLREGTALHDFSCPARIVIGCAAHDTRGRDLVRALYADCPIPITYTTIDVAEGIKYLDNIYHALKVTFANEVGNVCKGLGVDSHEAMAIFCQDTRLNLSAEYLRPGAAYGGSCLSKDLRAFIHAARSCDVKVPLLEAIDISNEQQKANALHLVLSTGKQRIGVLGLSFKAGTDDLRGSPSVDLVEQLLDEGCQVAIYEPALRLQRSLGARRCSIDDLPRVAPLLRSTLDEVLEQSDAVVVTNRNQEFAAVANRLQPDQVLVDLVRLPVINGHNYLGLSW